MKAIKRINNNVIICLDDKNNEVIARGKGIGFHDFPYEIKLSDIEKTYYNIDKIYYEMIKEIPDEIIDISTRIVDYAREKFNKLDDSNIVFTLADHINFSINRYKNNIPIKLPIVHDIQYLMKDEYNIGLYGLKLIKFKLGIYLPKDEAAYIALHIHKVISGVANCNFKTEEQLIDDIVNIIEDNMQQKINKDRFNYSRFVSHMYYLMRRNINNCTSQIDSESMYKKLICEYPLIGDTSEKISEYLYKNKGQSLNNEEKLYLILHISRLCAREQ
ncbi:MAG: PRD domain-containing protein [Erysipelotrichaceae bacterium]|jgi:beta-glucoside operon transcriptional antiterminator